MVGLLSCLDAAHEENASNYGDDTSGFVALAMVLESCWNQANCFERDFAGWRREALGAAAGSSAATADFQRE
jgi:hypothetical protein